MVVFPHAKINLGLFVTEKRSDGFHNLETVFYPIKLSDILEIGPGKGGNGECEFVNTGIEINCESGKNLVVQAYRLLARDYDLPGIYVHLHKIIPFGAGLGGGSSDAAFMLKALNEYFELGIDKEKLIRYAAHLGSDCAFFISGQPAFASGKGEKLEEIDLRFPGYRIVLVKPGFGVSTPEAYAGICPQPAGFDLHGLQDIPIEFWKERVSNDFETNVFGLYPQLANIKRQLYELGACFASMSGSGSAIFGLFKGQQQVIPDFPGCFVWQDTF